MGILECGDGASFNKELIDTDQTADVTGGHIFNGFNITTHHQNCTLNGLLIEILNTKNEIFDKFTHLYESLTSILKFVV